MIFSISSPQKTPKKYFHNCVLLFGFTFLCVIFYVNFYLLATNKLATTWFFKQFDDGEDNVPRVAIVSVHDGPERLAEFRIALSTVKCYAQRYKHYSTFVLYTPAPVASGNNGTAIGSAHRCNQTDFFFRRHCFLADWMEEHLEFKLILFLDGDVGVINPNHTVEEYIGEGQQLVFFDRLFNNEIMAGSYLARNSEFARSFLRFWGDYFYRLPKSFHGTDNGAIHAVFMEKYADEAHKNSCQHLWEKSKGWSDLNVFTVCVRHYIDRQMASNRTFDHGRVKVYQKARGWLRDGGHTGTRFSRHDFMFHGWKQSTLDKPQLNPWTFPFDMMQQKFEDAQFCASGKPWHYKEEFKEQDEQTIEAELQRKIKQIDGERRNTLKQLGLVLRIGQLCTPYESVPPKGYGAIERIVFYLTEEFVRRGHEVTLFASSDSNTSAKLISKWPALNHNPVPDPGVPFKWMFDQVGQQLDNNQLDILHVHTFEYFDQVHALWGRHKGKLLVTMHNPLNTYKQLLGNANYTRDLPLVSISDNQRTQLEDKNIKPNFIGTIYLGLPKDSYEFVAHPNGDKHVDYLAFLGRISPSKGPDMAIQIALKAGIRLKMAAKIQPWDRAYWENQIKPLIDQHNDTVEFLGEVDDKQKSVLLGNALAFLFPINWQEPFGAVMIESMACGTPVVARPMGSVPEIIEEGVSGFHFNTVEEGVQAVHKAVKLDRAGVRRAFERRFTVEAMADGYEAVYRRMLGFS